MWTDYGTCSIISSQSHKELTQELKDDRETRHIYIYIYIFFKIIKKKEKTKVYLELSK